MIKKVEQNENNNKNNYFISNRLYFPKEIK